MITEKDIGKKVRILSGIHTFKFEKIGTLVQINRECPFGLVYGIKQDDGLTTWAHKVELIEEFKKGDLVEVISHDKPVDHFGRRGTYCHKLVGGLCNHVVEFEDGDMDGVSGIKLIEKGFKKGDLVKIIKSQKEKLPTDYAFFIEYSRSPDFPYRLAFVTSACATPFYEKSTKIEKVPPVTPEKGKFYHVVFFHTIEKMLFVSQSIERGNTVYHFQIENSSTTLGLSPRLVLEEVVETTKEEALKPVTLEGCFNCEVEFYDYLSDSLSNRSIFVGKVGDLFLAFHEKILEDVYQSYSTFLNDCSLWKYARRIRGVKYLDD